LNCAGFELFFEVHANAEVGAIGREENGADGSVAFRAIKLFQQLVAKLDIQNISVRWVV